jgi:hypothetical protein
MNRRRWLKFAGRAASGLLFAAVLLVCASYLAAEWDARRTASEQHEVWSAYLNHESGSDGATPGEPRRPIVIVVQGHTQPAYRPLLLALVWPAYVVAKERPYSQLPSLDKITFVRYLLGALRPHPVRQTLKLRRSHRLATAAQIESYGTKRWDTLFPDNCGYFVLSSVGFNRGRTQALLYVEHICGLSGHGGYFVMDKVKGRWTVTAESSRWVS